MSHNAMFNDVLSVGFLGENFIIEEHWSYYRKEINSLYQDIHILFDNLFILRKLERFPFQLLGIRNSPFISTVIYSLYSSSIILASNLLNSNEKSISLESLKQRLLTEYLKPDYKNTLLNRLRIIKFDTETKRCREKLRKIRNDRVAHVDKAERYAPLSEDQKIDISDLIILRDAISRLFKALSFGAIHNTFISIDYSDEVENRDNSYSSDIDEFLNFLALGSYIVNLPENNPKWYIHLEANEFDTEKLSLINKYRRMKGLSEIVSNGDRLSLIENGD